MISCASHRPQAPLKLVSGQTKWRKRDAVALLFGFHSILLPVSERGQIICEALMNLILKQRGQCVVSQEAHGQILHASSGWDMINRIPGHRHPTSRRELCALERCQSWVGLSQFKHLLVQKWNPSIRRRALEELEVHVPNPLSGSPCVF